MVQKEEGNKVPGGGGQEGSDGRSRRREEV